MRGAFARFINHPLGVRVGLRDDFLVTLLRFGEFFFYFFRIELAFLDLAPALLQYRKDWLVREPPQEQCHDHKADHLRKEQLPIPTESFSCAVKRFAKTTCRSGNDRIHNSSARGCCSLSRGAISEREGTTHRKRSPR